MTKNATDRDFNLEVNVLLADIFSNASNLISSLSLESDILLLRNYFMEKAQSSKKVHTLYLALKGLQNLRNLPFLKDIDQKNYKYSLVDYLSRPFEGIKAINS